MTHRSISKYELLQVLDADRERKKVGITVASLVAFENSGSPLYEVIRRISRKNHGETIDALLILQLLLANRYKEVDCNEGRADRSPR